MLRDVLRDLKPTPASYMSVARKLGSLSAEELKPLNVAVLATFTAELLQPYLIVEGALRGIKVKPYFAPFNQLEQQVFDGNSALYRAKPDVVVIATRLEDVAPQLISRFITLSSESIAELLSGVEQRLQSVINELRNFTAATTLIFNYAVPQHLEAGLADALLEHSQVSVIQRANDLVAGVCRKSTDAHVFDYSHLVSELGVQRWSDEKLWYLGRIPMSVDAQMETGRRIARYLRAIAFPPCKCLVLDLDNTLWGGVLGEDGPGGIALGDDYPGNVFKDFQRSLLALQDRGVLLAVASKNNESDVLEVFQNHSDCLLKLEDFAALQINWQDKATNLSAIARELNIGPDALAFFDDNPVEREWVRARVPAVTVIEVPTSPLGFVRALHESGAFDQLSISAEDHKRTKSYQNQRARVNLQTESSSLENFLRELDMSATIGYVNAVTLPRVAQLLAKTNQFNLTTRRHTSTVLQSMIEAGAIALWIRVVDRFDDNGLVGAAVAVPTQHGQWTIDTFLLSCRVIGRSVESALLNLLARLVHQRGGEVLLGEYVCTDKNSPASEFYQLHDFEPIGHDGRLWKRDLLKGELRPTEFVKVSFVDDANH